MEIIIPYHERMSPGCFVNANNLEVTSPSPENTPTSREMICKTVNTYAKISSFGDVCIALDIEEEYVLKVLTGLVTNEAVTACLDAIKTEGNFSMVFRSTLVIQELTSAISHGNQVQDNLSNSHLVEKEQIGDELVTILTFYIKDQQELSTLKDMVSWSLNCDFGVLKKYFLEHFYQNAANINFYTSKTGTLSIKYVGFDTLPKYPGNLIGMIKVLYWFMEHNDRCVDWYRRIDTCKVTSRSLQRTEGAERLEVRHRSESVSTVASIFARVRRFYTGRISVLEEGELEESPSPDSRNFYSLKAVLKITEGGDYYHYISDTGATSVKKNILKDIGDYLIKSSLALIKLQEFLNSEHKFSPDEEKEGVNNKASLNDEITDINKYVSTLEFSDMPWDETVERILNCKRMEYIYQYIKTTNTFLSNGTTLCLLLMGQNGTGKKSTGNTILQQVKFKSDTKSANKTQFEWSQIDNREIQVVVTPSFGRTKKTITKTISDAITHFSEGFHALILVFRHDEGVTKQERAAVQQLKRVLGEDIIRERCICAFTFGDTFPATVKEMVQRA